MATIAEKWIAEGIEKGIEKGKEKSIEKCTQASQDVHVPEDVAVIGAATVSPEFHAQHDARGKIYRYRLFCRKARSVMRASTLLTIVASFSPVARRKDL